MPGPPGVLRSHLILTFTTSFCSGQGTASLLAPGLDLCLSLVKESSHIALGFQVSYVCEYGYSLPLWTPCELQGLRPQKELEGDCMRTVGFIRASTFHPLTASLLPTLFLLYQPSLHPIEYTVTILSQAFAAVPSNKDVLVWIFRQLPLYQHVVLP